MQDNKSTEHSPSWKGCITFGIINIILVLLATQLNIVFVSSAMIILLAAGFGVSFKFIKEDWIEGFKVSAIVCIIGLIFHCIAALIYATSILMGIIAPFIAH